jgi:hypothetical protein
MTLAETVPGTREGGIRGEEKRVVEEWIQVWGIWYIVRTFINATMYPHLAQE